MDRGDRKLILWWAVLLLLTLLSFESGAQWFNQKGISTAIALVIALFKIRVVILHFMEVADSPWCLRVPLELWMLTLGGALLMSCYRVFP